MRRPVKGNNQVFYKSFILVGIAAITVAMFFALRSGGGRQVMPSPPAERQGEVKPIRVVTSKRFVSLDADRVVPADVSSVIAVVCGKDRASANRYELRNEALRSVARRRNLPEGDVAALMAYVASEKGALHPAREAALRNDILNLLCEQEPIPADLPDLLMDIVRKGRHDAMLVDYAIQHLGILQHDLPDAEARLLRDTLFMSASKIERPYAGTAFYALADSRKMSASESERLRRLTVAACSSHANPLVRLSALQLAGECGYREVLPEVRSILRGVHRDAVTDVVAIGTLGLLGDASDIRLIESLSARGGSRLATPCKMAMERIKGRMKEE